MDAPALLGECVAIATGGPASGGLLLLRHAAIAGPPPAPLAISTLGDAAQTVGLVAAGLTGAAALLVRTAGARVAAMLGALVLAVALLVGHVWSSDQVQTLRDRPALAAGALAAGLAVVLVAGWILARRPTQLPPHAAAALPFRIPIDVGGDTANLLLPLYLAVAAGVVAYALRILSDERDDERAPGVVEWLLAASLALYAVQSTYSSDADRALEQIVFFYVPFAVLFALLVRVPWTPRLAAITLGVLVVVAVGLVGVGFWEYGTRRLLLNPRVINANQFESYFRVNSLFFDPNIYGRFLVIVMLGITAVVVWTARARVALAGALLLALLWAGLVLTFSQSSFAGLLAGLAVLGGLRWSARRALLATGVLAAVAVGVVLLAPGSVRLDLSSQDSVQQSTSGRYDLVRGGANLFAERPIAGWGSGSYRREYRHRENASAQRATNASHTIPVTVAAEQGAIGLVVYVALVVAALWRLLRRAGSTAQRAGIAAAFVALLVHTLLYAAFLEDPMAWALLGAGTGLAARDP